MVVLGRRGGAELDLSARVCRVFERRHLGWLVPKQSLRALAFLGLALSFLMPGPSARAQSGSDFRDVMVVGGYGAVAGTALGLAAYPITKSLRTVLLGTAVGLYLGIGAGVYHVMNRDNPNNPLVAQAFSQDRLMFQDAVGYGEWDVLRF